MRIQDPRITERRNPRTADIDLASPLEIVDLINAEDRTVADAVASQREQIAEAVTRAEAVFRAGGRLYYTGAGTSGRLGVVDASECPPTFGTPFDMVQGIMAGGPAAMFKAQEGAEDRLDTAGPDLEARGDARRRLRHRHRRERHHAVRARGAHACEAASARTPPSSPARRRRRRRSTGPTSRS